MGAGGGKSSFLEQLAGMFRSAGIKEKGIPFLGLWMTRLGKSIAPKRYHEAGAGDVEGGLGRWG